MAASIGAATGNIYYLYIYTYYMKGPEIGNTKRDNVDREQISEQASFASRTRCFIIRAQFDTTNAKT